MATVVTRCCPKLNQHQFILGKTYPNNLEKVLCLCMDGTAPTNPMPATTWTAWRMTIKRKVSIKYINEQKQKMLHNIFNT